MNIIEQNKAIILRFNQEFIGKGNIDVYYEAVHPEFVNRTAPPGMSSDGESVKNFILNVLRPAFPDLEVEIHEMIAENDRVVTRKCFHGTHQKEFMGIKPSGKKVTMPVIDIVRLSNGKYMEHWGIRDMQKVMQASAIAIEQ
jgi:predicted SnoaL-like aldol condensation-catalyzing enzyme